MWILGYLKNNVFMQLTSIMSVPSWGLQFCTQSIPCWMKVRKGAFTNYVDKILSFFWPSTTLHTYPEWFSIQKKGPCPISLVRANKIFSRAKTLKKYLICHWTFEIIQFIRFEMHMDRPDKCEFFLGYNINYLSIWPFMCHPCFPTQLKLKEEKCHFWDLSSRKTSMTHKRSNA